MPKPPAAGRVRPAKPVKELAGIDAPGIFAAVGHPQRHQPQHRPHGAAGLIAFQENGHAAPVLHPGHQKAVAAAAQTGSVQTGMGGQSGQPGQMPGGSFDPGSAPTPPSGDFRPGNRQ